MKSTKVRLSTAEDAEDGLRHYTRFWHGEWEDDDRGVATFDMKATVSASTSEVPLLGYATYIPRRLQLTRPR
jgi:hypothetical protein